MIWAVKKINTGLIEGGLDCLGNEEKRFGTTPDVTFSPTRSRTEVPINNTQPTGRACEAPLPRKCRKAARTVAHGDEDRKGIGKPSNVVKELAVKHGGKVADDVYAALASEFEPDMPVTGAPADPELELNARMAILFPCWKEDQLGFAMGEPEMRVKFTSNLMKHFENLGAESPCELAIAIAERLADVTNNDIRYARQVLDFMITMDLGELLEPDALEPEALIEQLRLAQEVRCDSDDENVRLSLSTKQALALQVAVSLSRHPHDFQALRILIHPDEDFSPDDARLYTKPAAHWLDTTDKDCADRLLQNTLQALDTLNCAETEEDRAYASSCLHTFCRLRSQLPATPAELDADHPFHQTVNGLDATQRRNLFAWDQGFRSVDDMRAAGSRMRKNCIWMWRSEAITKNRLLRWMPAPLRSLFWGKAPYQAASMGDGGASTKHAPEMQQIYDGMCSTLLRRLHWLYVGSTAEDRTQALAVLRNTVLDAGPRGQRNAEQQQDVRRAIEILFCVVANESMRANLNLDEALPAALDTVFTEAGITNVDVQAYLRHAGVRVRNPAASTVHLMDHCLGRRFLEKEFARVENDPLTADLLAGLNDNDPRTASEIFKALRNIEKIDVAPRALTIDGIGEYLRKMVHQNQDNTWRAEEKLGSGVNGVIFAGLAKFNSLGLRLTGIGAASAYAGVESKNWGMEITLGRRTHRTTGVDVRYIGGSEGEFGEHFKASLVAAFGYDSEHVDAEGIKIMVRRDYDEKGGIKNAEVDGELVAGIDGNPVQAHRFESQRVLDFFTNAARERQFNHVEPPAEKPGESGQRRRNGEARLRAYDSVDVFASFANEFFDSKLVSLSQTHATSSTQRTSAYCAATARAALERDSQKFQIGTSAMLVQAASTHTKNTTRDQNGKQALNMASYNHAVDVRSGIGVSGAVLPGFNPKTTLPTTANPVGLGVTVTYRAHETRGQLSLLKKNGLMDAVFCYSGENYKRPEQFRKAIERDLAAWVEYFGSEDKLQAAIDDVVASAKSQNVVLMVRRRLREHIGPRLDALEAQIDFQRSILNNPFRSQKQRELAELTIAARQRAMQEILSSADSFEPFGLGAFSRIEKTRHRGISYYAHFVNTQSISATQELSYKARKPVERDTARHHDELKQRDGHRFGRFLRNAAGLLQAHEEHVSAVRALVRAEDRDDPRGQGVEDARHERRGALRRLKLTQRLNSGWTMLLGLRHDTLQWRLNAGMRDDEARRIAQVHAGRLEHTCRSMESLLRHIHSVEDLRASGGGVGLVADISNPSYHLLRSLMEYANTLAAEAITIERAQADGVVEEEHHIDTARLEARRAQEAIILQEIRALLAAVRDNVRMMESVHYETPAAIGWVNLHQLALSWERLHEATLREQAAHVDQPVLHQEAAWAEATELAHRAAIRVQLQDERAAYNRLIASDLSDDEQLQMPPTQQDARRLALHAMQRHLQTTHEQLIH
jgi:hypothetical protein